MNIGFIGHGNMGGGMAANVLPRRIRPHCA